MAEKKHNVHGYFKTGEFARLCGVKKQTLFHYDDIGLFSPEIVEENGYRYYSTNQIELFEVIQILRDLNMSLKEILDYLNNRSADSLITLFQKKGSDIDRKIEELIWQKNYMKDKLDVIQKALAKEKECVLIEDTEEEYFITTEYHGPDDDRKIAGAVSKHVDYCESIGVYSSYVIGGMIPTETVPSPEFYNYSHFYAKLGFKDKEKRTFTKPAGKYAVIYHLGSYDDIYGSYNRLAAFCAEKDHPVGKYFYENEMINQLVVRNHSDHVIKIAVYIDESLRQIP